MMRRLKGALSVDLRALALFRICISSVLLVDLFIRARDVRVFYSDFGLMPRWALTENFLNPFHISIHLISGTSSVQYFFLLLAAGFAFMLLLGCRTRLASIVSWFLLMSLQNRNPTVLQGGDDLLRMLLFWGMFLPLGAYYSVDAAVAPPAVRESKTFFSAGSAAVLLQVVFLYFFTAWSKSGAEWNDGSAVYYALSIDQLVRPLGKVLLRFPDLLTFLTYSVRAYEFAGALLLLIPGAARLFGIAGFLFLQVGLGFCMRLGPFPWVATAAMIPFLPGFVFDSLGAFFSSRQREKAVVYYDGECGFCKKMLQILRTFLLLGDTEMIPAQSDPAMKTRMEREHSWIVAGPDGKLYFRMEGFSPLLRASPLFSWLEPVVAPLLRLSVSARLYDFVAAHRPAASKLFGALPDRPARVKASPAGNFFASVSLAFIAVSNLSVHNAGSPEIPAWFKNYGAVFRLEQNWAMFAPFPLKDDGWYVIPGRLRNGEEVDLFRDGAPVTWEKPADVSLMYKNERWRKYMMNLYYKEYENRRLYYGQYLCRWWNERVGESRQLVDFDIVFVKELTLPDYKTAELEKVVLWKHFCFGMAGELPAP